MAKKRKPRPRLRDLAEFDLFPALSARLRRCLYNPLSVLLLAASVALLCGFFLHSQGFVLCGCLAAVVGVGVLWPWVSLHGITGAMAFDRSRASEGEEVELRLSLHNQLAWPAWGLTVRNGFGSGDRIVASIAAVPARRTAICRWGFTPPRRGVYPVGDPRLATGFPFGLWENSRRLSIEGELIVWPKTFPVGPVPPVRGDRQVEGNVSRNKVGSTGDVLGVRPYRRGDSPRRIHWGQSAKHDRLIVCELQSNARPVIQLVLDADARVHTGAESGSSREWAIRIVASLARGWLENGAQVGLAWAGFDLLPSSGTAQLHKILDALAALPETVEQSLADVLSCPKCRGFRDGLQVIVTTDRAHVPDECGVCSSEDQRWVVLTAAAFADAIDITSACQHGPHTEPWLRIDSVDEIPSLLRGGWREARHGS